MPVARMRMRPWLEDRLDSETISGLVWLDKEKKIFSIPWKHAARHGWEMEKDACLFKQWAIHTGKFKVGMFSPDPKTWKANFRCAMNSLPDIVEVKDKSVNKGCGAVRVYKMLQTVSKKRDKRSRTRDAKQKNKNRIMDDECPNVNEVDLLMDHNPYTKQEEDSRVDSTGDLYLSHKQYSTDREVPEWSSPMEMRADSTNIYSTFQVSPSHSSEFDEESEIIQMAQQLEQDQSQWSPRNVNDSGYLSSAVNDTSDSFDSHESQWSEDSGEEIELRLYTELKAGPSESIDLVSYLDPWANSTINILQQSPCLL